ncbi:hypothetical protein FH972_021018 [Carpinus fangiana]|uniref:Uncharacterized protein n=1 Tax=Carpinus fangiana TaxID=176857 RepID=A0A5N6KN50_9ROSI|nr:hypothetical protein FH972_021018 [Carpinus fangiana]
MSPSASKSPRIFLITGCSTGIGASLAQEVIDRGDIAVATARKPSSLKFKDTTEQNFLPLPVDLYDRESIVAAFDAAVKAFGRVDAFINNADGTRKAMEVMRAQSPPGGAIMQVTSIGGLIGFPLMSMYSASKFAVEGLTEAIAQEVKPEWNIHFTCVEPGGFRTDFFHRSMTYTDQPHPAYDHVDLRATMKQMADVQMGDPAKGARAIYEAAVLSKPPSRLLLGTDAYNWYNSKLESWAGDAKENEHISLSTDVDAA